MIHLPVPSGMKSAGSAGIAATPMLKAKTPVSAGSSRSVAKARDHVGKLLDRIRAAHDSGQHSKARHLTQLYLGTYDARYLAVREAYRKLRKDIRPKTTTLPSVARSLNARAGTQEKVLIKIIKIHESPDWTRVILEFGLENSALQELVLPVLEAQADLNPNQYLLRGAHVAIKRVARLLKNGYEWVVEIDISDSYQCFDRERVPELLPIPKEVTRRVLLCGTYCVELGTSIFGPADSAEEDDQFIAAEFPGARQGIPQGSVASPLVVEMLLAPLFDNLPQVGVAIGHGGNLLAMAKTEGDALSLTSAILSGLEAHPAGQLQPDQPRLFASGEPIEFLGHYLRVSNDVVRIDPSKANLEDFDIALQSGLHAINKMSLKDAGKKEVRKAKLRQYVRSWTAAFKMCTDIDTVRKDALKRIAMAA
jgi:hypothetical protein